MFIYRGYIKTLLIYEIHFIARTKIISIYYLIETNLLFYDEKKETLLVHNKIIFSSAYRFYNMYVTCVLSN